MRIPAFELETEPVINILHESIELTYKSTESFPTASSLISTRRIERLVRIKRSDSAALTESYLSPGFNNIFWRNTNFLDFPCNVFPALSIHLVGFFVVSCKEYPNGSCVL